MMQEDRNGIGAYPLGDDSDSPLLVACRFVVIS
jgi:hypothetical protein